MPFKLEYICGRNYNPLSEHKHIKYMERCFELASKGHPNVYPNPLVGAVVVANDKIIGEGYHTAYGKPHAEVEAIRSVQDVSLLQQATLYVNLEPCSHHGKTPPCADLIIENRIPEVVICNVDPHDKVAGKGIAKLQAAGIHVTSGILANQGIELNRRFMRFHLEKRPYIVLKWAQTADGYMGRDASESDQSAAISNSLANMYVHQLRAVSGAIFVGTQTAISDNPRLTTRLVDGPNPLRIVVDIEGRIPTNHHIFSDGNYTLVLGKNRSLSSVEYVSLTNQSDLLNVLNKTLYSRQIDQVLIEGGASILKHCIATGLWDELHVITAPQKWNKGIQSPDISALRAQEQFNLKDNEVSVYRNN